MIFMPLFFAGSVRSLMMLYLFEIVSLIASASVWISLICPPCLGRGNMFRTMFNSMQSLHNSIILCLSFSTTNAVVLIVLLLWIALSVTCPIIFIVLPLLLILSAFLAVFTGSPCALAILFLIIVVVEPISGSAQILSRA